MLQVIESPHYISLIIDRPDVDNRLNADTLSEIRDSLLRLRSSETPQKVLTLTARGENFSLGRERSAAPQSLSEVRKEFELIQSVNELLYNLPLVTISAVHGRTEGAGLSLAGRCDIVLAADNAQLSFPEIPHGIPPTIVLSHYRYKLPAHLLGDLFFAGREFSGQEAVHMGLAARSVPNERLTAELEALVERISGYDRDSLRLVKRFLRDTENVHPHEAPKLGIAEYVLHTFRSDS